MREPYTATNQQYPRSSQAFISMLSLFQKLIFSSFYREVNQSVCQLISAVYEDMIFHKKKVIFSCSMHLQHTHVSIRLIANKLRCTSQAQNHMVKAQVRVYHGAKKHSIWTSGVLQFHVLIWQIRLKRKVSNKNPSRSDAVY